jgi:hypothetical protein
MDSQFRHLVIATALSVCSLAALPAEAATRVWTATGGDGLWSNAANWDSGAPVNGDDVVLNAAGGITGSSTNDLVSLALNSILFAQPHNLSGNRLFLGAGGINSNGGGNNTPGNGDTVGCPITLTSDQTWSLPATISATYYQNNINGAVDLAGHSLTIAQGGSLNSNGLFHINGTLSGAGALIVTSSSPADGSDINGHIDIAGPVTLGPRSSVTLGNSNHFTGLLTTSGVITLANAAALPAGVPLFLNGNAVTPNKLDVGVYSVSVSSLAGNSITTNLSFNGGQMTVIGPPAATPSASIRLQGTGAFILSGGTLNLLPNLTPTAGVPITITGGTLGFDGGSVVVDTNVNGGTLLLRQGSLGTISVGAALLDVTRSCGTCGHVVTAVNLTLNATSTARFEPLANATDAGDHGEINVSGAVALNNSNFQFVSPDTFPPGFSLTLIRNSGPSPVSGTFAGLPEGSIFTSGATTYQLTYVGGTSGRDVVVTVLSIATTTQLNSTPNPSTEHTNVTLSATVSAGPGQTPTGNVTFFDGSSPVATAALDGGGVASDVTSSLTPGTHSIHAEYAGASGYSQSTSNTISQVVNALPATQTSIASSKNPSVFGQSVTFSATVTTQTGIPAGSVSFYDGASLLATVPLDSSGHASHTPSSALTSGTHAITAQYSGSASYAASTSPVLSQQVSSGPVATQLDLASSLNPSNAGESVTFTATIHASGGTPTGTVTLRDGGLVIDSTSLPSSDIATFHVSTLSIGTHSITASYGGDDTYAGSTSPAILQTVNPPVPADLVATASSDTSIVISWLPLSGAASYELLRNAGSGFVTLAAMTETSYTDRSVAAHTSYLYEVRAVFPDSSHSGMSRPDLATTIFFTDLHLTPQVTVVRAIHVNELRIGVNAVATLAHLSPPSFTDPALAAGMTIKAVHLQELRNALDAARAALGLPHLSYDDPVLAGSVVKAIHVQQIRDGVK